MNLQAHDLPAGLLDWVADIGGGKVTSLRRHVARREAWVVDVTRPDGSMLEGFLRLDRHPDPASNVSLYREARICAALGGTSVPVPRLHGWNDNLHAALFSRDPGRSDIDKLADTAQQRAVMEDFIRVIARLHRLEPGALGLDDVLGRLPASPAECALDDLNAQLYRFGSFLAGYSDPLITFGTAWLRRNVPATVTRVSLVQGDTGPVNFMFQDRRVSAVIDWEWGHWGDPMEDLGNICVREFWNPSGGLEGLFRLYEQESGIPYSRAAAHYYRVQQNVRGMIPIHAACANPKLRESLAWYLCYRFVGDRSTCEALAETLDIVVPRPEMPGPLGEDDVLLAAAVHSLQRDLEPHLTDPFTRARSRDIAALLAVSQRRRRYGAALADVETREIADLLGTRLGSYPQALGELGLAIAAGDLPDADAVRYLCRRAWRDEWLHAPVVELYPARSWSAID